ncbi:MAG: glycosyltransferase family 4 protein [Clostridiales bacterium]|nr:glycosyltransferase family 4 protein [Clostridiales bacterium]
MAEKVLLIASVASMIQQFNMRNITILQDLGYDVEVACNFENGNTCSDEQIAIFKKELKQKGVSWHQIDFARNVFQLGQNSKAYHQLKNLVSQKKYKFMHCHSPIGGVLGRLVAHKYKTPVMYTAHGFHFFKGAPKKNWLLFYAVEKFLSRYTDELLVINHEDYELAKKKFHMKHLTYIPGVGVKVKEHHFSDEIRQKKREELGIPQEAFMITCAAEFTANKNQITVIRALEELANPMFYYVMCGIGEKKAELEQYVEEKQLGEHIKFVGFRKDMDEILYASDCFVLSSLREGLSVALMEAMAAGLPVVCGKIRGNIDLVEDGVGGYLVSPMEIKDYQQAFIKLVDKKRNTTQEFVQMGKANQKTMQKFCCEAVDCVMHEVYSKMM